MFLCMVCMCMCVWADELNNRLLLLTCEDRRSHFMPAACFAAHTRFFAASNEGVRLCFSAMSRVVTPSSCAHLPICADRPPPSQRRHRNKLRHLGIRSALFLLVAELLGRPHQRDARVAFFAPSPENLNHPAWGDALGLADVAQGAAFRNDSINAN
jgi:hypothetical protein